MTCRRWAVKPRSTARPTSALASELRSIQEGLEQAVEDRTVRLEQLYREKEDFLSVAVHELQSPLAGLRNLFRWLRSQPPEAWSSNADQIADAMESAADAMDSQVKELLRSQKRDAQTERSEPALGRQPAHSGRIVVACSGRLHHG